MGGPVEKKITVILSWKKSQRLNHPRFTGAMTGNQEKWKKMLVSAYPLPLHGHELLCPFLSLSAFLSSHVASSVSQMRKQARTDLTWPGPSLTHKGQALWSDPCLPLQPRSPPAPLLLSSFQPFGTAFISSHAPSAFLTQGLPSCRHCFLYLLPHRSSPVLTQPSTDWWMLSTSNW